MDLKKRRKKMLVGDIYDSLVSLVRQQHCSRQFHATWCKLCLLAWDSIIKTQPAHTVRCNWEDNGKIRTPKQLCVINKLQQLAKYEMNARRRDSDSDGGEIGVRRWKLFFSDIEASFFPPITPLAVQKRSRSSEKYGKSSHDFRFT
jgi:hypothetical protein